MNITVDDAKLSQPYIDSWDDMVMFISREEKKVEFIEVDKFGRATLHEVGTWYKRSQKNLIPIERSQFVKAIFKDI